MRRGVCCAWVSLVCFALAVPEGTAQPPFGAVTGVTMAAADEVRLPGVSLLLTNQASGTAVRAVSTDGGLFRIDGVAAGRYSIDAAIEGFEPLRIRDIAIVPGETASVVIRLAVATVRELVRVIGAAPRDSVEAFAIRESGARDVGEALTTLPGVATVRKAAIANDVVLRGFQGKDVTVLIDGQRIDGACPGKMDPPAFHVDFAEVGRVEVSRGPFDVRNQGGLAGVVNVVTHRPQRGWHGSGNLVSGSAATLAASAAASVGAGRWAAFGGVSSRGARPYRDGAGVSLTGRANYQPETAARVDAYALRTAWARLAAVARPGTTLHASYAHQSAGTIVYPYLQMDGLADTATRAGARLEIAELPGGWGALAAHAYRTRVAHWMTDEYRTSAQRMPRVYSMATDGRTEIAGARAEISRGPFSYGAEISRRNWNTRTMLAPQLYASQAPLADATIDVSGGFVALALDLQSGWHVESGARLDHAVSDVDRSPANTALYLAYTGSAETRATDVVPVGYVRTARGLPAGWTVTFGVGHAARLPDQQERYYALHRMGTDWVGNPHLSPSRNTGVDAELRRLWRGMDLGLTAFAYRIDDHVLVVDRPRLQPAPGVMNAAARSYANVDALVRGMEAAFTAPLRPWLFLTADGSFTRGTTREDTSAGRNLPEIPPARARLRLRFDNARWNAAAELDGASAQSHVAAELGETRTPAWAIVNLRGGVRLPRVDVLASVDNLLDAFYAEHLSYQRDPFRNGTRVYEPGRTLMLNVSARF